MNTMVKPLTFGRLGNFLFQAATAIGYAKKYNREFTLPDKTTPGKNPKWNPVYLQHLVNPKWNPLLPTVTLKETQHTYMELPNVVRHNVILDGYWQTEKYFKDYREDVLKAFGYPWKSLPGTVSVHVRRGDYVTLRKKHPVVTDTWIRERMDSFPGMTRFHFFSDDIPWCRAVFGRRPNCFFSKNKKEEDDLVEMSWCADHICSASTFSWWGAWLNQNPDKRIVIPKQWFLPGWGGLDTSDIVPPEWEKI